MENQNALTASNESFLRDLQLFCNIARRGSFVAASTEMGLSPSHVSKRLAMLEASLGVKLFQRTTRRVSVTSDGEAALQWAQKILDDVQGMADAFADRRTELRGLLRISTSVRLGRKHVSPILAMLRKRHPNLEIWLELLDRRADLVGENFDIDVRVGPGGQGARARPTVQYSCHAKNSTVRRGFIWLYREYDRHRRYSWRVSAEPADERQAAWRSPTQPDFLPDGPVVTRRG